MELEFDKEIDAILRRAQQPGPGATSSPHLDADVIAAFAENVLPERARSQYTLHLADCDRCRKHLSQTISISEQAAEPAAVLPISAPAAEVTVPWYKAIFRTPNLAIAMGGLILVFSGILGFLVLQGNRNSGNTLISQVSEQESAATPSFANSANSTANANSAIAAAPEQMASNNSDESLFTTANTAANTADTGTTSGGSLSLRKEAADTAPAPAEEKSVTARQMNELPRMATAPPPPPSAGVTMDGVAADKAKQDTETRKAERSDLSLAAKRKEMDTARSRDLPPAAAESGPGRSGPVQMQQNQNARNAVQMSVTRSVGGRKFTNRDGAWYDTGYKGQATTNVRRGGDEFKKLDSGLRSIANEIEGVIVVVWKSKAYRIQ